MLNIACLTGCLLHCRQPHPRCGSCLQWPYLAVNKYWILAPTRQGSSGSSAICWVVRLGGAGGEFRSGAVAQGLHLAVPGSAWACTRSRCCPSVRSEGSLRLPVNMLRKSSCIEITTSPSPSRPKELLGCGRGMACVGSKRAGFHQAITFRQVGKGAGGKAERLAGGGQIQCALSSLTKSNG